MPDLNGVEILKTGRFNGVPFERSDLLAIVDAFEETAEQFPPRLQLGHDLRQRYARALFGDEADGADGLPALGWVRRLRVKGDKLYADFADVPEKLVELLRAGAYRARSGGLLRDVRVGDRVIPWVLDHVALLGEQPPAVPGMADVALHRDGLECSGSVVFAYEGAGGLTMADEGTNVERELLAIEASLATLAERIDTLTKGKKGNPLIRARIRGLREELRRAVKLGLAQGDTPMDPEAQGTGAQAAPTISSPETLVAMIAAKLDLGPEDYAGIWAKIAGMIGGAAADTSDIGGETLAKDDTPAAEPAKTDLAAGVGETVDLAAKLTAAEARVAALELAAQTAKAEARVDADIGQRSLPAGVRPVLVKLALEGQDDLYKSVLENAKPVPTAERGTTAGVALSANEPTEAERKAALDMGYDVDKLREWKAAQAARTEA